MSVAVIICTVDRPAALRRVLKAVHAQTVPVDHVVVCPPDATKLPQDIREDTRNIVVDGVKGLTRQRNLAVTAVPADVDYIAFFDDDAYPRADYLEKAAEILDADPGIVGVTGFVVRDGAKEGYELTETDMQGALEASWQEERAGVTEIESLYGCNMVIRAAAVRANLFDERLPLYGWLEDLDFARRVMREGRLVRANGVVTAHQGSNSGGRRQHRRLGYSQLMNPVYMMRKGSLRPADLVPLVGKPVLASVKGSVTGAERAERRERLRGMAQALGDISRGRLTPERMAEL